MFWPKPRLYLSYQRTLFDMDTKGLELSVNFCWGVRIVELKISRILATVGSSELFVT